MNHGRGTQACGISYYRENVRGRLPLLKRRKVLEGGGGGGELTYITKVIAIDETYDLKEPSLPKKTFPVLSPSTAVVR